MQGEGLVESLFLLPSNSKEKGRDELLLESELLWSRGGVGVSM